MGRKWGKEEETPNKIKNDDRGPERRNAGRWEDSQTSINQSINHEFLDWISI